MKKKSQSKILPLLLVCLIFLVGTVYSYSNGTLSTEESFGDSGEGIISSSLLEERGVVYTPTTDTTCNEGICTKTLWSGIRNVYEDDEWKRVENARSLKGKGFNIIYLEEDGTHQVEVVDFNTSFIELSFSYDAENLGEYEYEIEKGEMKTKYKIVYNDSYEEEYEIEIEEGLKETIKYYGNPFGKEFHFGENSTTIQLQDAGSENLDDTYGRQVDPNTGFGGDTYTNSNINEVDEDESSMIYKFNISSIPDDSVIVSASISLYLSFMYLDSDAEGYNVSVHHLYSFPTYNISDAEWTEEAFDWNERPITDEFNATSEDTIKFDGNSATDWNTWAVTNIITIAYGAGDNNVSFWMPTHDAFGTIQAQPNDRLIWQSKEHGTVARRPYLNITYFPDINIISPTASQVFTEDAPTTRFNITTGVNMDECYYELDSATNFTMNKENATAFNITNTSMVDGPHSVKYYCNQSTDGTLYEYYNSGDNGYGSNGLGSAQWRSQTFTIGNVGGNENFNLDTISLKLYRAGSPGIINASIRAVNGTGQPTGPDLSSGIIEGNSITESSSGEWYNFSMSDYTLQASTKYAIVVRAASTEFRWRLHGGSPTYAGGSYEESLDSGVSWLPTANIDHMFEIYSGSVDAGVWRTSDSVSFDVDSVDVTVCRDLTVSNREYELRNDISNSDPCFSIKNGNLSFDGNNYNINGDASGTDWAIAISGSYDNITIKNHNLTDWRDGLRLYTSDSIIVRDTSISGSTVNDVSLSSSINNSLINVTYSGNENVPAASDLTRLWYFSPQVNYSNGTAINGANVTAYNTTGIIQETELTDVNGQITTWELIEYINNGGARTYYTNYTIAATFSGWATDSQEINLTINYLNQQFTLELFTQSQHLNFTDQHLILNDGHFKLKE